MSYTLDLEIEYGLSSNDVANAILDAGAEFFGTEHGRWRADFDNGLAVDLIELSTPANIRTEDSGENWFVGARVSFRYNISKALECSSSVNKVLEIISSCHRENFLLSYEFEKIYVKGGMHRIVRLQEF